MARRRSLSRSARSPSSIDSRPSWGAATRCSSTTARWGHPAFAFRLSRSETFDHPGMRGIIPPWRRSSGTWCTRPPGATTSRTDEIVVLVSPDKVDDMLFAVPYTLAEIDALRAGEDEDAPR